jgi:hypothetical protein
MTADDRIDHGQIEKVDVCQEATDGGSDDSGQVSDRAQDAEGKSAEGTKDQPEQDQLFSPELIGQRAARHTSDQTEQGRHPQQDACLGHADSKLLGDVQSEEREEQRTTDAIDEPDHDHNPEQTREHLRPFVWGDPVIERLF